MNELLSTALSRNFFAYLMCLTDYLLVFSAVFALLYALAIFGGSIIQAGRSVPPIAHGLPVLFLTAILVTSFSGLGEAVIFIVREITSHALTLASALTSSDAGLYLPLAGLIWLAGALVALARLVARYTLIIKLLPHCPTLPENAVFLAAKKDGKVVKKVMLKLVEAGSPMSLSGLRASYIFIPAGLRPYTPEELYGIYLHELTHIRRKDSIKILLSAVIEALFWFNPLMRRAVNRFQNHLEIACDQALLKEHGLDRFIYARAIINTAASPDRLLPGLSNGYADLGRRLSYIFNDRKLLTLKRDRLRALTALLGAAVLFWHFIGWGGEAPPYPFEQSKRLTHTREADGTELDRPYKFAWHGGLGSYAFGVGAPEIKKSETELWTKNQI